MGYEQVFPVIASLAILVWLAPAVFRMSPAMRERSAKLAFGLIVVGIGIALVAFAVG
ncbi:MAG TPA: hypothetical protein VHL31_26055 [Geminicoccus sp.]|jgi:hypothetical protein|uniref:hypothetical protein n=1 Tax=Geminicoccus sp. TaxID=2024832 RepID=UPI002E2F93B0|nr:hypothetical protein [Geminicoccus sp.]HEX2529740.1 hypothetical protein [Geminicoccus sp.]